MTKLVIFDFDGTLCDTAPDCVDAFNEAFRRSGAPERAYRTVVREFGKSLPDIVADLVPKKLQTPERMSQIMADYRSIYGASEKPKTQAFPGMLPLLRELTDAGVALAVHSNKIEEVLTRMTETYLPGIPVSRVIGFREGRAPKPAPDAVLEFMKDLGAGPEETLYIGDGAADVETARRAGIHAIFVTWGTGKKPADPEGVIRKTVRNADALKKAIFTELHLPEKIRKEGERP